MKTELETKIEKYQKFLVEQSARKVAAQALRNTLPQTRTQYVLGLACVAGAVTLGMLTSSAVAAAAPVVGLVAVCTASNDEGEMRELARRMKRMKKPVPCPA